MLPAGSSLPDWLTWLETLSPKDIDLGLERVQSVLERLDLELPGHVLLIAGTNGKGSSVALLQALLKASGYRVGTYTSPHVI
ncbi:MAG: bifunctional folylpolyglutamate synthase/dihydrofolate synthase, partial [Gammaproteobacteria bacterium]|nr:bifunctional folylpolyglutamate synthase/dihydrofolate synthase [Gammaproteobacteria bacterium]